MAKREPSETRQPLPPRPGKLERFDYEYERKGTANGFMLVAPRLGCPEQTLRTSIRQNQRVKALGCWRTEFIATMRNSLILHNIPQRLGLISSSSFSVNKRSTNDLLRGKMPVLDKAITLHHFYFSDLMPATPPLSLNQATIGIITALQIEHQAMLQAFDCYGATPVHAPVDGAGHRYNLVEVPVLTGGSVIVAIGTLVAMGTNIATARATQMQQDCPNIRRIIMAGIAGAVPNLLKAEDHVRLGDIVVSNDTGVIQFDLQKETDEEIIIRGQPKPPSFALLEAAQNVPIGRTRGPHPWEADITTVCRNLGAGWSRPDISEDRCENTALEIEGVVTAATHPIDEERTPGSPRVFFGPIGSSNTLLKSSARRDYLRDKYQVKAIEMEAAGIAAATGLGEIGYLVVRGTCDYCNRAKGDKWQKYAAVTAAVFTRHIITQLNGKSAPTSILPSAPTGPAPVNIQADNGSVVQHITGGQIGSINIQSRGIGTADIQKLQAILGRVEERLASPVQSPSEQDLADYQQRIRDDIERMKNARQIYEYDEVSRLITKIELWLLSHRQHLPVDLFDEAWLELLVCERFRQDVRRSRGEKWDGTAINLMMKEIGHA